jgi:hypothetical protein
MDYQAKPGKLQAAAILVLINGILNILSAGLITLLIVIGTLGIGLICLPILLLPFILGVFEIIYGVNLMAEPPRVERPNQALAGFEIACILYGNVLSLAVGIISLVFYSDPEVKAYFDSLGAEPAE